MPEGVDPCHRLLTEITPLRERDRQVTTELLRKCPRGHIDRRQTTLLAPHCIDGAGGGLDDPVSLPALDEPPPVVARHDHEAGPRAQPFPPEDRRRDSPTDRWQVAGSDIGHPAERAHQLDWKRWPPDVVHRGDGLLGERGGCPALDPSARRRAGEEQRREVIAPVADLESLADMVALKMGRQRPLAPRTFDRHRHRGIGVDPHAVRATEDGGQEEHLPAGIGEECLGAFTGGERGKRRGAEAVDESHRILPRHQHGRAPAGVGPGDMVAEVAVAIGKRAAGGHSEVSGGQGESPGRGARSGRGKGKKLSPARTAAAPAAYWFLSRPPRAGAGNGRSVPPTCRCC